MIPSKLLFHYFKIAQHKLGQQQWLDEEDELQESSVSNNRDISWHQNQVVKVQLESLDEAISKWQSEQDSKDIQIVDKE